MAEPSEDSAQAVAATQDSPKRQAVILIHGMGEQRPMQSLRKFVEAVWATDAGTLFPDSAEEGPTQETQNRLDAGELGRTWGKPSDYRSLFDLRVISTRYARNHNGGEEAGPGKATDFYELYWAHLMQGNTMGHVMAWVLETMLRWPGSVPRRLLGTWIIGWVVLAIVAFFSYEVADWLTGFSREDGRLAWLALIGAMFGSASVVAIVAGALSSHLTKSFIVPVLGDAARYLRDAPPNIAARQNIRQAGVDLLEYLHACGRYDRIVVAGHSLGSVIGYDVLAAFWAQRNRALSAPPGEYETLEQRAYEAWRDRDGPQAATSLLALRQEQRRTFERVRAARRDFGPNKGDPVWLVSDFVSFGSPLGHADVLLQRDPKALREALARLDLPTCPPTGEPGPKRPLAGGGEYDQWLVYPRANDGSCGATQKPNHAAVFLPVRWTNIHMPTWSWLPVVGDFISAPVAPRLGPGVIDIPVRSPFGWNLVTHLHYWRLKPGGDNRHVRALRCALNLTDRFEERLCSPDPAPDQGASGST